MSAARPPTRPAAGAPTVHAPGSRQARPDGSLQLQGMLENNPAHLVVCWPCFYPTAQHCFYVTSVCLVDFCTTITACKRSLLAVRYCSVLSWHFPWKMKMKMEDYKRPFSFEHVYSEKRNVTVWRPSVCPIVCLSRRHTLTVTHSVRRGQHTFRPDNKEARHTG